MPRRLSWAPIESIWKHGGTCTSTPWRMTGTDRCAGPSQPQFSTPKLGPSTDPAAAAATVYRWLGKLDVSPDENVWSSSA